MDLKISLLHRGEKEKRLFVSLGDRFASFDVSRYSDKILRDYRFSLHEDLDSLSGDKRYSLFIYFGKRGRDYVSIDLSGVSFEHVRYLTLKILEVYEKECELEFVKEFCFYGD